MRARLRHELEQTDFDGLARSFAALAELAPRDFDRWSTFAAAGVRDARAHDLEAVRGVCAACHHAYRARYRAAHPARAVTPGGEP